MGCVISAGGISPTEEKIEAIKQALRPKNLTQPRAFLGMINYHGKFILNLSSTVQPLNQLLQSRPHATTGSSPAKLFLQRELRTRLSLVIPDIGFSRGQPARQNEVKSRQACQIQRCSCRRQRSRT